MKRARRSFVAALALLAASTLVAAATDGAPSPRELRAAAVPGGSPTPVVAPGVVTHVVFFAPWCPPCVEELDRLTQLEDRWLNDAYRLVIVGVPHRQTAERLASFARTRDVPGRLLYDGDGSVRTALAADGLPTHVVFDADGREAARSDRYDATIERALARVLDAGTTGGRR